MHYYLLLISSISILAVRIQSQDLKDLGKSWCGYYGLRNDITCNLSNVLVTEVPDQCTTLVYTGLIIDVDHSVTDIYNDFAILDDMLASGKTIITYIGHDSQSEWATILECESSNGGIKSLDETKGIKVILDKHQGVAGVIFYSLQYDSTTTSETPGYSENLKKYLEVMKTTFPNLSIGLDIYGNDLIDQYIKPKFKWLDISAIDSSVNFYIITVEAFNICNDNFRNTGSVPMNGSNTNYTLEKLRDVLQQASFPKEKIIFKFYCNPSTADDYSSICKVNYEKLCVQSKMPNGWCADTILSNNEKGQYSANNGAGFMVRYIDFDDPYNCCNCEKPYSTFNAILDGFNGVSSKNCELFDKR